MEQLSPERKLPSHFVYNTSFHFSDSWPTPGTLPPPGDLAAEDVKAYFMCNAFHE
jgi:hypothetical protein